MSECAIVLLKENETQTENSFIRMQSRFILMILNWLQKKFLVMSTGSQKYECGAQQRGEILKKELSIISNMQVAYAALGKTT